MRSCRPRVPPGAGTRPMWQVSSPRHPPRARSETGPSFSGRCPHRATRGAGALPMWPVVSPGIAGGSPAAVGLGPALGCPPRPCRRSQERPPACPTAVGRCRRWVADPTTAGAPRRGRRRVRQRWAGAGAGLPTPPLPASRRRSQGGPPACPAAVGRCRRWVAYPTPAGEAPAIPGGAAGLSDSGGAGAGAGLPTPPLPASRRRSQERRQQSGGQRYGRLDDPPHQGWAPAARSGHRPPRLWAYGRAAGLPPRP